MENLRILHLEDDSNDAFFVRRALEDGGFKVEVVPAASRAEFISAIDRGNLDAILIDQGLPGFNGGTALELAREHCPKVPFIVVSGAADERRIASSLKAGASDYVLKSQLWRLPRAIRRLREAAERNENKTDQRGENKADLDVRVRALAARLDSANREMEAFSYSVLHDLRAPLRTIEGYAQLAGDELAEASVGKAASYLKCIQSEALRMNLLLGGLAEWARLARVELNREKVDLSAMAEELVRGFQEAPGERGTQFLIQPGLGAEGDPGLLRIALGQLLSNAWKFTGARERASIEFGAEAQPDGSTAFFLRDDGIGFDPKHASHLFAPFQRLHRSEDYPGAGVGLALAKRIVQRHGGRIWADAAEGRGATFYFTLPPAAN
jgi:signal transduction histidine kinase